MGTFMGISMNKCKMIVKMGFSNDFASLLKTKKSPRRGKNQSVSGHSTSFPEQFNTLK